MSFVHGASAVVGCRSQTPVSILTPRPRGSSVWAYTSTFGGGMVAGDTVRLDIRVDPGANCFLGSQASNKIYRNPLCLPCTHQLCAKVGEDAILVLAPDPVQCFSEASYEQRQTFELSEAANLILVDWFTAGRMARGERWSFRRYFSRNDVIREGQKLMIDALDLDATHLPLLNRFRAGRFNCLATVFICGPVMRPFTAALLNQIAADPIHPRGALLWSASPVRDGLVVRVAGGSIEDVGQTLYRYLRFVPALLKDDPWARKW